MTSTPAVPQPKPASQAWPELDLFRGLAVIAMVANHAVARWQGDAGGFSDFGRLLFQVGGVAPVLFFFATGFGSGLQSLRPVGTGQHRYGLGRKLAILVLADQFIFWRWGVFNDFIPRVGLDFLGFIALSTLVVEPLRRAQRATTLALLGAAAVLVVRFAISPWILPDAVGATELRWFGAATGRASVAGLAYPPFPWLAYPLLGFAVGRSIGGMRESLDARAQRLTGLLAATSACCFGAANVLAGAGFEINRYGIHSLAYLPVGAAAVAGAGALAWGLGQLAGRENSIFAKLSRAISVRGVASLVVVPIHFAIVFVVSRSEVPVAGDLPLAAGIAAMTLLCLTAGRSFGRFAEGVENGQLASLLAAAAVLLLLFATWWPLTTGPWTRHGVAYAAQFALCGLLVWMPATSARKGA